MEAEESFEEVLRELSQDENWENLKLMLADGGCVCPCCLSGCH